MTGEEEYLRSRFGILRRAIAAKDGPAVVGVLELMRAEGHADLAAQTMTGLIRAAQTRLAGEAVK